MSAPHIQGRFLQRSFEHLLVTSKKRANKTVPTRLRSPPNFVHGKDRIALWNISPGDRVRVVSGGHKGKTGTIDYVDREKNRVYLQENEFCRPKAIPTEHKHDIFKDPNYRPNQSVLTQIPIHYSNVQLVLQRSPERLATDEATGSDAPLPEVVAKRLRAVNPKYNWKTKRWEWKRLAEAVGEIDPATGNLSSIEWNRRERFNRFLQTPKPSPHAPSAMDTIVPTALESTFDPSGDVLDTMPREMKIREIEFVNKYGRARRNKMWHEARAAEAEAEAEASKDSRHGTSQRPSSPAMRRRGASPNFLEQ